ncbi:TIR domain-containing protein [Nocardia inohanensis]|uniref:WD40 domain-containing protein n=1 Tax=Nocardia inohanensis TaxID=209246 RepID=UPI00082E2B83|nr:TIR domain-containing protein [Nocardia inohanensis]
MSSTGGRPGEFFISYSPADERWATWLAWELETAGAGYRTLLQSWDFAPGTDFDDFAYRGVREAAAVLVVWSPNYVAARHTNPEWQAALDADPAKLLAVRVAGCSLEALPAGVRCLDLAQVDDGAAARDQVLDWVAQLPGGRSGPGFPARRTGFGSSAELRFDGSDGPGRQRRPPTAPAYPGGAPPEHRRTEVSILHVAGPRFGRTSALDETAFDPETLQSQIRGAVGELVDQRVPAPDLLVVSGDLTESANLNEFQSAATFLRGLRVLLKLEPGRVVVVPGNHDVSKALCQAYILECEANNRRPQPPFYRKLELFERMFGEVYRGLDDLVFDGAQPWTLFPIPELRVVVAGLNSTLAATHLEDDNYGFLGDPQSLWFAEQLREFERLGWFRLGVLRHDPMPDAGTSPWHPELLRDTAAAFRHLAPHLNLLLHGPGPGGVHLGWLGEHLPVLPAAGPGRAELIHLTAHGLTRYPCENRSGTPVFLERAWRDAAETLPPSLPASPAVTSLEKPPVTPEIPAAPALKSLDLLLNRIEEVCRVRYPGAKLRRIPADLPCLLVTAKRGEVVDQWRIGAHDGVVTWPIVEEFLNQDPEPGSELVYSGRSPDRQLRERAGLRGVRVRSFTDFQGLLDLDDYLRRQTARLREEPRYASTLYVPQRFRILERGSREVRTDLIDELLHQVTADDGRFILLLGDFGRGKSFALRELALRIGAAEPSLVPLFIELRTLDRTRTVESLIAAHLANYGEDRINLAALTYMLEQGRVVLLFDGFDELVARLSYESAADHMDTLLQAAIGKAKIVVAARTQHFRSRDQVSMALGERLRTRSDRTLISIEDFTDDQVRDFLDNRYPEADSAAANRMLLLHRIPALLALARNPRMLSFIAELDEHRLRGVADAGELIGPTMLYETLLDTWLKYEISRAPADPTGQPELRLDELRSAVTLFALRVWNSGEPDLGLSDLGPADLAEVARSVADRTTGPHRPGPAHLAHYLGSRSLIVRTDDNRFALIHPSVTEWLVMKQVSDEFRSGATTPAALTQRHLSDMAVGFLCDLADVTVLRAWIARVHPELATDADQSGTSTPVGGFAPAGDFDRAHDSARADDPGSGGETDDPDAAFRAGDETRADEAADAAGSGRADMNTRPGGPATEIARANAVRIATRLHIMPGADLHDAILAGAELADRDLRRINFAGADLSRARLSDSALDRADLRGARLIGADLARATVAGADLRGADLTEANLTGADLTDADLSGARLHRTRLDHAALVNVTLDRADLTAARLLRADLSGSRAAGSRWTRAVLIEVAGRPADTELAGAIQVPGTTAGTEFAPATIGVRHGIDTQHGRLPRPLAYSPDGRAIALGCDYGGVVIYGADTGRTLRTLQGHRARAVAVAFTEHVVVSGSADGTARIWDAATGELRKLLRDFAKWPWPLEVNGSGELLATGDAAGVVRVFELPGGVLRHRFAPPRGFAQRIFSLAFHGDRLAAGYQDGTIRVWDSRDGTEIATLPGDPESVRRLAWDPTGTRLAVGGANGRLAIWDLTGGVRTLAGHRGSVYTLAFHPADPAVLASGDNAGAVILWNASAGTVFRERTEHGNVPVHWLSFDPAGGLLATGDAAGLVFVRDAADGAPRHRLAGHTSSIWPFSFRPDGSQLAVADGQSALRVWDPVSGTCCHVLTGHGRHVRGVSVNADGTLIAGCGNDGSVRLWDSGTGQLARRIEGDDDGIVTLDWAVFSPTDPNQLATVARDGTLRVFAVDGSVHERRITIDSAPVWAMAYDPTGQLIATANDDDTVTLWTLNTGGEHAVCGEHRGRVRSITFTADGGRMATGCDDGKIRVWEVATGALLDTLSDRQQGESSWDTRESEPLKRVYGVAVHADRLAGVSWDATVRVWNPRAEQPLYRLSEHHGKLWCAAVDRNAGLLATAGDDLVIQLWDLASGQLLHSLAGHRNRVRSLAFDPTGSLLVSGGNDGCVMLWSMGDPPALLATLLGLPEGWVSFTPDGRYKTEGLTAGQFWQVIGMYRFEVGELEPYQPQIRQIPLDERL